MSGFFIGIDVGGTNLKAGLTDETGRLLAAARRPLDFRSPPSPTRCWAKSPT